MRGFFVYSGSCGVPNEAVQTASPNANGTTRGTLVVKSNDGRATVIDGQSYSNDGNTVMKFTADQIETCKQANRRDLEQRTAKSLKLSQEEPRKVKIKNGFVNFSETELTPVRNSYEQQLEARRVQQEFAASDVRRATGTGNLDDIRRKLNELSRN